MDFLTNCHRLASQIRNHLEAYEDDATQLAKASDLLTEFLVENGIETENEGLLGSFFSAFISELQAAATRDQTEVPGSLGLLFEFCGAMAAGLASMEVLLTSIDQDPVNRGSNIPTYRTIDPLQQSERIPFTVLIVEDDATFADALERAVTTYFLDDQMFEIQIVTHVPARNSSGRICESSSAFARRLTERLHDLSGAPEGGLARLQAAIVDYALAALPRGDRLRGDRLTGIEIAQSIARASPNTHISFLSGENLLELVDKIGTRFGPAYSKADPSSFPELFKTIRRNLERKYETPFWDSLKAFTERPLSTFHAMPLARGRSLERGQVLRDFKEFFGQNYFDAETSATIEPLDSLLHPVGSIKRAEEKAAWTFGAMETFFVTNGTSTANKIVLQALLGRGDAVLIDRNCHVSHHYGISLLGARPFYLEPYQLPKYGISGGIPRIRIEEALAEHHRRFEKGLEVRPVPKVLMLTNRTFDGVLVRPKEIIETVRKFLEERELEEHLREMVFFFDEAWFAYGRFHAFFVEYSSLAAAERLRVNDSFYADNLRVYATQSTHKTLSAFRQGSMIHSSDPLLARRDVFQRFDIAFRTHTTTSPHSGIIASLDVASRQMTMEGCARVNRALFWAQRFRADAARDSEEGELWKEYFRVLAEEEMVPADFRPSEDPETWEFRLDPTCITIHFPSGWSGADLKHELLVRQDVQINKHSENTLLMMVTLGSNYSDIVAMKMALMRAAETLQARKKAGRISWEEAAGGYPLPPFTEFFADVSDDHHPGLAHDVSYFADNRPGWATEWVELADSTGKVSVNYVSPYPPGYPILVPGQLIDDSTAAYLKSLSSPEIHGIDGRGGRRMVEVFLI